MIKLDQITLPIKFSDCDILSQISKTLKIKIADIKSFEIFKLSIDARKKPNVKYVASIGINLNDRLESKFSKFKYQKFAKELIYDQNQLHKFYYLFVFDHKLIL